MATRASRMPPVVAVLAIAGAAFLGLPVVALVVRAPWSNAWRELSSSGAWTALRLSVVVSVLATGLCLVFGLPLAWVLARSAVPGRALLRGLVLLPLVLPPVVGGIGLLAALGRSGLLGRLLERMGVELPFTTAGAVAATTFVALPLAILATEAGFRSMDSRLEDAAITLGASPWYVFRRVTLPLIRPQLAAGLILAWARALGEFGATITFAGNLAGRTQTLPLAVYQTRVTDPGGAILISLMLVALSIAVFVGLRHRLVAA